MDSNEGSQAIYMKVDVSTMKNVDTVCEEIQKHEKKINLLFLTAGSMTLKGRNGEYFVSFPYMEHHHIRFIKQENTPQSHPSPKCHLFNHHSETSEGIEYKLSVNYYSRIRFIHNLLPQLNNASTSNTLSRVISVLAAGSECDIDMDDLDLKRKFTLSACLAHSVMMTDFMMEELAVQNPGTSFSHSYPGTVKSGIANSLTGPARLGVKLLYSVMTPWILNVQESGQRHVFQITSSIYPCRNGGTGISPPEGMEAVTGSNGVQGSGAYLLDYDGSPVGDDKFLTKYRDLGAGARIWDHTMEILRKATNGKRRADEEAEGEGQAEKRFKFPANCLPEYEGERLPNLAGWRPA